MARAVANAIERAVSEDIMHEARARLRLVLVEAFSEEMTEPRQRAHALRTLAVLLAHYDSKVKPLVPELFKVADAVEGKTP